MTVEERTVKMSAFPTLLAFLLGTSIATARLMQAMAALRINDQESV